MRQDSRIEMSAVKNQNNMSTILLTSGGMTVKEEILKILPKPLSKLKMVCITTAHNPDVEKNPEYVSKDKVALKATGLKFQELDIKDKTEKELRKILSDKNVIYVQGGNSFYLLKYIRESGFDKVVKDLINQGVVYIGVSAGSMVACQTIETANWKHQDKNEVGLEDFTAMGLVPFNVFVHYSPEYTSTVGEELSKSKFPLHLLTDSQALLIKDGKVELVGEGKEAII